MINGEYHRYNQSNEKTETWVEMKEFKTVEQKTTKVAMEKVKTMMLLPYLAEEELKPGDIILSYYPKSYSAVDVIIKKGQSIIEGVNSEDSSNYVHASIYLGNGKVAEAVKEGLTINPLSHERFKIKSDHTNEFRVFRSKHQHFAQEIARAGKVLAQDNAEKPKNVATYNYLSAIFSLFKKGQDAIKHYLKAAYFSHTGEVPYDNNGVRNFHCSYVVAWLLQAAESANVLDQVNSILPQNEKIVFPDLSHAKTPIEKGKLLDKWAADNAKKHEKTLQDYIKIGVDAKYSTPQRLYKLIQDNSDIFTPVLRLIAPPSPGSETELKEMK